MAYEAWHSTKSHWLNRPMPELRTRPRMMLFVRFSPIHRLPPHGRTACNCCCRDVETGNQPSIHPINHLITSLTTRSKTARRLAPLPPPSARASLVLFVAWGGCLLQRLRHGSIDKFPSQQRIVVVDCVPRCRSRGSSNSVPPVCCFVLLVSGARVALAATL